MFYQTKNKKHTRAHTPYTNQRASRQVRTEYQARSHLKAFIDHQNILSELLGSIPADDLVKLTHWKHWLWVLQTKFLRSAFWCHVIRNARIKEAQGLDQASREPPLTFLRIHLRIPRPHALPWSLLPRCSVCVPQYWCANQKSFKW